MKDFLASQKFGLLNSDFNAEGFRDKCYLLERKVNHVNRTAFKLLIVIIFIHTFILIFLLQISHSDYHPALQSSHLFLHFL